MLLRYNQNFWQFRITRQRESFIILNNVRSVIHTQTCTQVQLFTPSACCFTFRIVLHNGKRHFLNINNKSCVSYCCYKRSDGGKKILRFYHYLPSGEKAKTILPWTKHHSSDSLANESWRLFPTLPTIVYGLDF